MQLIEVIVNVPIRRTFSRQAQAGPPPEALPFGDDDELPADLPPDMPAPEDNSDAGYQSFHYHLPPELETVVRPGHLVWVPFGAREVQGFVLAAAASSPVPTKAVRRLARPEPVLTPVQLALAHWLAHAYVAPLVEAIKLFLPPGLLTKDPETRGVRAKREITARWAAGDLPLDAALARVARVTNPTRLLAALLNMADAQADAAPELDALAAAAGVAKTAARTAMRSLQDKGLVTAEGAGYRLAVTRPAAAQALDALQGTERVAPILAALAATPGPVWKSDLAARVTAWTETDLATLRKLQEAGLIALEEQARFRDPLAGRSYPVTTAPPLTGEQTGVWAVLEAAGPARMAAGELVAGELAAGELAAGELAAGQAAGFLVHGVTGSGKTEIYLRAIAATLALGRQAIVLVPEIALTPQTVARFAGRFPGKVTVIHSGLSTGERYDVWRKLREGAFDVVVGPRSALFAPLPRLGLIVVDEEHEPSYKQDAEVWGSHQVYYDARPTARRLAELVGGMVIYGSATPSLEAYTAAQRGELTLLTMPRRVMGHAATANGDGSPVDYGDLPPVELVDMRLELRAGNRSVLSRSLQAELHATLGAGQQTILFLNRRGSNTFVMCRDCGGVQKCPRCDVPLTYHERAEQLICHHCNRKFPIPTVCPTCGSKRIRYFGTGTQRIEELVHELAPQARVLRWDADTAARRGSHEEILRRFAQHEADVLVGTQMIAKGLDLPLVTLVGVVAADVGLYLPDFRSGERTFQLLTQVAGRAGRSARGGRVVIQSYTPDHYVIQAAARHDYAAFYAREMAYRTEMGYPPLRRVARLVYWERRADKAQAEAERMAALLRRRLAAMGAAAASAANAANATVIGAAPAFFARFRGNYRWQIVLMADDPAAILRGLTFPFGWRVDVDPVSVL